MFTFTRLGRDRTRPGRIQLRADMSPRCANQSPSDYQKAGLRTSRIWTHW